MKHGVITGCIRSGCQRACHSQRGCLTHLFPCRSGGLAVWGPGACIAAFCESLLPGLQTVPPHCVLPQQRPSKPGVSSLAYRDASFLRLRPHPVAHSTFITSSGPASISVTPEVGASTCGFWGHCQPKGGAGDSRWTARTQYLCAFDFSLPRSPNL